MEIFAHRGSSGTHPENTLPAFVEVAALPVHGVELDVHLSTDDELVVIHDEKVNRTTNGKGYVKDMTLAELKTLDAGSWKAGEWAGTEIPTLAEVFGVFKNTHHVLNVELKTDVFPYVGAVEKVAKLAAEQGHGTSACHFFIQPPGRKAGDGSPSRARGDFGFQYFSGYGRLCTDSRDETASFVAAVCASPRCRIGRKRF
ncbi:glycerophosphoryl diester phosphodiesterase family protein [Planococcus citreus]|uniref:Glycerophosphoryl diester phosphodiesterase family protein n=1 Tax=Planococcus citreus TaxID=1373 RepID=A0A497YVJ4_9BACL|nr:glycerophosphoryl diester phosphodiesterase family protein [Planococcus citreus]